MGLPFFGGGGSKNTGGSGGSSGGLEVIEWPNMGVNDIIYRWPNDRITLGSVVVVRAGQAAVFLRDGKIMGVLTEGRHVLNANNFPWISGILEKIPVAGKLMDAFKSEIYFVSLTEKRATFGGKVYAGNMLPLKISGDYRYKVEDPAVFLRELAGTSTEIDNAYITNTLRNTVMSRLTKFFGDLPPKDFTETLNVQNKSKAFLETQFEQLGLKLIDINLQIQVDEKFESILPFLQTAQNWQQVSEVMRMHTLQQMAQTMGQNPAAGMGVGMGMGMMMPYMMAPGAAPAAAPAMGMGGYVPPQQGQQPQQAQMKKCPNCGAMVPANAKFCPYCGYKFEG